WTRVNAAINDLYGAILLLIEILNTSALMKTLASNINEVTSRILHAHGRLEPKGMGSQKISAKKQ
ncbi:MAG: hypothetical protein CL811_08040, partial [Colwelliaceae bacterium]|nr:hypothetical protein [Colwelliaceae bacterium]